MPARLYLDDDVDHALAGLLRLRGVDAVSTLEAGTAGWPEERHLERAAAEGRALVSYRTTAGRVPRLTPVRIRCGPGPTREIAGRPIEVAIQGGDFKAAALEATLQLRQLVEQSGGR